MGVLMSMIRSADVEYSTEDDMDNITTDAVHSMDNNLLMLNKETVTLTKLEYVSEHLLDVDEKVSLIYLLYEHHTEALLEINNLLNNRSDKCALLKWAEAQIQIENNNWQKQLLEALTVIQDFRVLKYFDCDKNCAKEMFLPYHGYTTAFINKIRKAMFTIFDNFSTEDSNEFLRSIRRDFEKNNKYLFEYHTDYLEIQFLFLESKNYLSWDNLKTIMEIFKTLDMVEAYETVSQVLKLKREDDEFNDRQKQLSTFMEMDNTENVLPSLASSSTYNDNSGPSSQNDDDVYFINKNRPGKCLIIDIEYFYNMKQFSEHPMHQTDKTLSPRTGTKVDGQKLVETFKECGFTDIIYKRNLDRSQFLETVETVCEDVRDDSCLFVCVLSHGKDGLVYGSDSCAIKISEIEHIMQNTNVRNLLNKPKVLILQSCRGEAGQKVEVINIPDAITKDEDFILNDEDLEFDSPNVKTQVSARTADFVTYYSTVKGFSALRGKKRGAWFIQELCNTIQECCDRDHFAEICTKTNNKISKKNAKLDGAIVCMVPQINSTLKRKLFFPKAFYVP